jgi:hypothetical protein
VSTDSPFNIVCGINKIDFSLTHPSLTYVNASQRHPAYLVPMTANAFWAVGNGKVVKSRRSDGAVKSAKTKARESRGVRRTFRTPQRQRDEAQHRYWPFSGAIKKK